MFKPAYPMAKNTRGPSRQQRGSALVVALVFLLIMTLIGSAAMQGTSQQENMAGNFRDHDLAFQAAEAALSSCLRRVQPPAALPPALPSPPGLLDPPLAQGNDPGTFWTAYFQNNPSIYSTGTTTPPAPPNALALMNVIQQPSCIIENMNFTDLSCLSDVNLNCFRVTARGIGGTVNTIAIVQSLYYR